MDIQHLSVLAIVFLSLQLGLIQTADDKDYKCSVNEDCVNGATCHTSKCVCLDKTLGPKCEVIDCGDFNATCANSGGECKYNTTEKTPYCECLKGFLYNKATKECEYKCNKTEDCKNGAKCVASKCVCLDKTSGQKCEIFYCDELQPTCGISGGECKFNTTEKTPYCECPKGFLYNETTKQCEYKCNKTEDCVNGAACHTSKCVCLDKTSGPKCDVIDCGDFDTTCGSSGGNCSYNTADKSPFCECPDETVYHPVSKACEIKCTTNDECENGATCEASICVCLDKTSGPKCGAVDCGDFKTTCASSGGECKYNVLEKTPYCECPKGKQYNPATKMCDTCECGENSTSCSFGEDKKICVCKEGFADKKGKCEACECGDKSVSCSFEEDKKTCACEKGYADKKGTCEACECGEKSVSCSFEEDKKTCVCEKGFADMKGKCEVCACGENTKPCRFEGDTAICDCMENFVLKDLKCEELKKVCEEKFPKCLETKGSCNVTSTHEIICKCRPQTEYKEGSGCIVSNATCTKEKPQCFKTDGVCILSEKDKLICKCSEGKDYFSDEGCKDLVEACSKEKPLCLGTHGSCSVEDESKVTCVCPEKTEYSNETGCTVLEAVCKKDMPKCLETEGVCNMTADGNITCFCSRDKEYNETRGCAVNKCKSTCGVVSNLVLCEGDPFGEADVSCKCADEKMKYIPEKKICKYGKGLSTGGMVGIIICVIVVFVVVLLYIMHRKKSLGFIIRPKGQDETVAFESTLYNTNYATLQSGNSQ